MKLQKCIDFQVLKVRMIFILKKKRQKGVTLFKLKTYIVKQPIELFKKTIKNELNKINFRAFSNRILFSQFFC